jgi:hypothetical protein
MTEAAQPLLSHAFTVTFVKWILGYPLVCFEPCLWQACIACVCSETLCVLLRESIALFFLVVIQHCHSSTTKHKEDQCIIP